MNPRSDAATIDVQVAEAEAEWLERFVAGPSRLRWNRNTAPDRRSRARPLAPRSHRSVAPAVGILGAGARALDLLASLRMRVWSRSRHPPHAPEEYRSHPRSIGDRLLRQRRDLERPMVDNPWLLPGEFVVDEEGIVRLAFRYQHCEDFPNPLVLAAAIRGD